jgi:hypothetical protein
VFLRGDTRSSNEDNDEADNNDNENHDGGALEQK